MEPYNELSRAFTDTAKHRMLPVTEHPADARLLLPLERELGRTPAAQPDSALALSIDGYYVLIAQLANPFVESDAWKRLHDLHVWAGIIRANTDQNRKDDINLLLAGPHGSEALRQWKAFAATVERDDRICRKLVWLPGAESDAASDAREFVARTFLAQPWQLARGARAQELDAGRRFRIAVAQQKQVAQEDLRLATVWWPLLVDQTDEEGEPVAPGAALVKRLIEAFDSGKP